MKKEFTIVEIEWTKDSLIEIQDGEPLLYQAYGDSPIYGRDVLLYIGQTIRWGQREANHKKSDFNRISNLRYLIGKIQNLPDGEEQVYLDNCESLLITMLKPSYNSSNVKQTAQALQNDESYLILNKGDRGDIPLEISNIWWDDQSEGLPAT